MIGRYAACGEKHRANAPVVATVAAPGFRSADGSCGKSREKHAKGQSPGRNPEKNLMN